MNRLYFGDNLDVLRTMNPEAVDLVYLDPPFNSNAEYNVLYGTKRAGPSQAQAHAFEDTWRWGPDARRALEEVANRDMRAGHLLDAFHRVFGDSPIMAYLSMMAVRLIELQRVLKAQGSLYLHCDPTASHYLKLILDAIFGADCFVNEITWKRSSAHSDGAQGSKHYGRIKDTILFYSKSPRDRTWNRIYTPYSTVYLDRDYRRVDPDGRRYRLDNIQGPGGAAKGNPFYEVMGVSRHWRYSRERMQELIEAGRIIQTKPGAVPQLKRYLDEMPGIPVQDLWTDIQLNNRASEKLPYPTQKPLALLERIIAVSSNPGDVVLDPFCGCGTAIEAAQKLGRRWIGIDITYLAIHVIEARLAKTFGPDAAAGYELLGSPRDAHDARVLASRDWLEFQKWAVMMLGGLPNTRPGADKGIDGVIRYHRVGIEQPNRAIVSVKGGRNVDVDSVHKLKSVVDREGAETGVLVCLNPPTKAMRQEAANAGEVGPVGRRVAKIQIITVDMLFGPDPFRAPGLVDPPSLVPPSQARPKGRPRKSDPSQTEMLLSLSGDGDGSSGDGLDAARRRTSRAIGAVNVEVVPKSRLG